MTLPYDYVLIRPADQTQLAALGPDVLGIEVTDAALAARCGLGNIDPQHGGGASRLAAIDMAWDWPLPPPGSRLVTIKADSDAVGAMAVLRLRQQSAVLTAQMRARGALISRWDRFDHGDWRTWHRHHPPLPHPATLADLGGPPPDIAALRALAGDRALPLADRVAYMARWLVDGDLPMDARERARDYTDNLLARWNSGEISITRCADRRVAQLTADGAVGGLFLGYRFAPVVVAQTMGCPRRVTIGQFETGWADLPRLCAKLSALEPGWGGSATLIASPQQRDCRLDVATILPMLHMNLL